ncbi:MAG: Type II secretion system protein M [Candidatus Celerinatantimonas neptuna]|nr:MAG: Type II secretion system protein M [Candidatus Celerinatantimonas neptuna]
MNDWWQSRNSRERWILSIGGIFLLLIIIYQQGWLRFQQAVNDAQQTVMEQQHTLRWAKQNGSLLFNQQKVNPSDSSLTFNQAANQSAASLQIAITRLQQSGQSYEVWIDPQPFDVILKWLTVMQHRYGYPVDNLDLKTTDQKGIVQVVRLKFGSHL